METLQNYTQQAHTVYMNGVRTNRIYVGEVGVSDA